MVKVPQYPIHYLLKLTFKYVFLSNQNALFRQKAILIPFAGEQTLKTTSQITVSDFHLELHIVPLNITPIERINIYK